ncbi:hypothetical protein EKO24_018470 [Candidatus Methylobacter oryzae]|uniref:Uncharacterized protein n=1 Tax=Candidatus Methylobacter oryzae TaxID=2497749 RepID=A0ABY3C7I2_9GAMM|nr:hypothetical protein EKO24_018470 [Candidatus Methylobacter oryzae]
MLESKTNISTLKEPCAEYAAFSKKSPLLAQLGVRVARKLDFYDGFGNLCNAGVIAGVFGCHPVDRMCGTGTPFLAS